MVVEWDLMGIYHLVIQHSHGESPINGSFNGKIHYKWAIFHGYVKLPEGKTDCRHVSHPQKIRLKVDRS